jgi:hypothetical protein
MTLLTKAQRTKLIANGAANIVNRDRDGRTTDFKPVVKFFCPWGAATWLVSEMTDVTPDGDAVLFGLCDLGFGTPEMGYVTLGELMSVKRPGGLGIERDRWFTATMTVGEYAEKARAEGRINA